jgi:tetratricopeptide (TPR) repeat protein
MTRQEAKMTRFRLGLSFAIAFAVIASAGHALAQDQAAIEKLVQMNKKALDDYDTLEWDGAKKTLLDALVAGKKAGLDNHPVMARTYVHLGAVYITGFRNRVKAIQSFNRALEIDPAIQLSKGIATAEVNDAFQEAKRARGGGGG